jgi:hypothetical protein
MRLPRLLAGAAFVLLAACETMQPAKPVGGLKLPAQSRPQDVSDAADLRQAAAWQDRLDRVSGPLLVANADLCKRHARNLLGISARNKYSFSTYLADAAEQVFGLDERLQVASVLPGGGADKAGVLRGDILIAAEGKPLPRGERAENQAAALLAPLVAKKSSIRLTLQRGGEQDVDVPLTRACGFRVELGDSDNVNSYSDGRRILVTRGMMRFARNDAELTYVIAKEMAHNTLNHALTLKTAPTASAIIDRLVRGDKVPPESWAGLKPMPPAYDIAADNLSLQMSARAGQDIEAAPAFWQRLTTQYPGGPAEAHATYHPLTKARLSAMTKTIPRIRAFEEKRKAAGGT